MIDDDRARPLTLLTVQELFTHKSGSLENQRRWCDKLHLNAI